MNKSIKPVPNLFTYKIPMIKLAVKEMQSAKFYAILLASVILVGIFSLSPAFSALMRDVIIRSTGRVSTQVTVTANSGSAEDIQAAVDQVAAMGGGNVYIPEGTFNFIEIGDPWQTVNIPAGVNVFGAPTDRDSDGQVITWKTVLVMPFEAPDRSVWFRINGNGDPNKPSRFSDIKLVGYREFDSTSTTICWPIDVNDVIDFRIDHCYFRYTTGGISIDSVDNGDCSGVIDHNKLINEIGVPAPYDQRTVDYGVAVTPGFGTTRWEPIDQVVGKYTRYTVFIEDNYFQGWRHCVSSGYGAHYVFRHNIIQYDFGYGSIDAHGTYTDVGTRAFEIYSNQMLDSVSSTGVEGTGSGIWIRGGGGVIFNNTVRGYYDFIRLANEGDVEKCWPHDLYIWGNDLEPGIGFLGTNGPVENVDYFLYEKPGYQPYPYPHPLTLEATP